MLERLSIGVLRLFIKRALCEYFGTVPTGDIAVAKISISMTDTMEAFVHERIKDGDYNNVSEYFRDLVRRDQENREKYETLKAAIQRGIDSGISPRTPQEIMVDVRNRLMNDGRLHIKP